ncbi:MAG: hypothetical protein DHS20C20_32930 [Ardenticatenaceae bacterium]|nr:MAG: hypothetical protein DHS20C20_32930 [Ardenticatenaceae bacterium]
MAEYRQIHTRIWKDSWFLSLEPAHKLLFIYLFGNERASVSGIYELPLPVICFETGLEESVIQTGLALFAEAGKVVYEDNIVWVVNLRKYNDSGSSKVKVKIDKDVAAIPEGVVKTLYAQHYQSRYPIRATTQTQIPYPAVVSEQEQEQEKEQEKETETEQEQENKHPPPAAARKEGVEAVFAAWKRHFPGKPQPRRTAAQREKVQERLNSVHFQEVYETALATAAQSRTLQSESWFSFEFFVKNEANYQKMLDGWMAWKDKQLNGTAEKPTSAMVSLVEAERLNHLLAAGEI